MRLTTSTVKIVSAGGTYGEYARSLTFTTFIQHREYDLLTIWRFSENDRTEMVCARTLQRAIPHPGLSIATLSGRTLPILD